MLYFCRSVNIKITGKWREIKNVLLGGPQRFADLMSEILLDDYFRRYGLIAIFTAIAVGVPTGMMVLSWFLSLFKVRPSVPTVVKKSIYECGFETISGTWNRFNFRFYSFALIFVIFDVETVFMFPWAVIMDELALFGLIEMLIFLFILVIGYAYAWRKGALEWA